MSDNNSLDLHIRTTADPSGFQSVTKETEALKQGLQQVAGTKAADAMQLLTGKGEDLKKALAALGREFPEIGRLAEKMLNPIALAVTGAVAVYSYFRQEIDKLNEAMDESARKAASPDFADGIAAKKVALQEAGEALTAFGIALRNASKEEDSFSKKIADAKSKLQELANAQAEVEDAGHARDLALVDEAEKGGKITQAQAITQRAALREQHERRKREVKDRAEQEEIRLAEQELQNAQAADQALIGKALEAKARRDALQARLGQAQADLGAGEKKFAEYQAEAVAAMEKLAEAENAVSDFKQSGAHGGVLAAQAQKRLDEARRTADEATSKRDAQGRLNARNRGLLADIETEFLPSAQNDWESFNREAVANRVRITTLSRDLPLQQRRFETRRSAREEVGALQSETGNLQALAGLHETAKRQGQEEKQLVQQITRAIESNSGTVTRALLAALEDVYRDQEHTRREIAVLRAQLHARR